MRLMLFLALSILITACGSNNSQEETTTTTPAPSEQAQKTPATTPDLEPLPSLPMVTLEYLWNNCDFIDYVFYELPISMSLDNQKTIQYVLGHIAEDPAPLRPQCKSIGRIFYQVDGENVLEADMYFSEGCTYLAFREGGEVKYANYMTQDGVNYLNNNFQQVNQMNKGQ